MKKDILTTLQDKPAGITPKKELEGGIQPTQEQYKQLYLPILHNAPTNELAALSNAPIIQRDDITKESVVEAGALRLFIDKYTEVLAPRGSVFKLFDMLCIELAKVNDYRSPNGAKNRTVTMTLARYMELCGLDPTKKPLKDKTRRRVHEDLHTLYNFSLEWKDPRGGKYADFKKQRICGRAHLEKGVITFTFEEEFANALNASFIGQYPVAIFRLDDRNKNAYPLARKIAMHASNDNNIQKGTAHILSVETLLAVCPDIPSYKEVVEKDRAFSRRIRDTLEKALDALEEFTAWEYCNSKGAPLTEEQLQAKDWNTYRKLLVKFTFREEPDHTARLARKAERISKRKPRAKNQPAK